MVIDGFNSERAPGTSGVPQGSVLGPGLFNIYISDVEAGLNNRISKFGDDTKTGNSVLTDDNRHSLQEDLHKILAWSDRWEMPFNVDKCQVLQVGTRDMKFDYKMRGVKLKSVRYLKRKYSISFSRRQRFSREHVNVGKHHFYCSMLNTF